MGGTRRLLASRCLPNEGTPPGQVLSVEGNSDGGILVTFDIPVSAGTVDVTGIATGGDDVHPPTYQVGPNAVSNGANVNLPGQPWSNNSTYAPSVIAGAGTIIPPSQRWAWYGADGGIHTVIVGLSFVAFGLTPDVSKILIDGVPATAFVAAGVGEDFMEFSNPAWPLSPAGHTIELLPGLFTSPTMLPLLGPVQ